VGNASHVKISYGVAELQTAYYLKTNDATQTVSFPCFANAKPVQSMGRSTYRLGFIAFVANAQLTLLAMRAKV
jgi:hypothetical protein